jgi:transglutaminase-like putative cysteine protease
VNEKRNYDRSWVDYALAIAACSVGSFSIGQSIGKPILASFLVLLAVVGITVGGVLGHLLRKTKFVEYDAALSGLVGFAVFAASRYLNGLLPEEGFPFRLIVGSTLSWLVFFVGIFAWRDATLLFVSIPVLAMFGLVGTFDTYPLGTLFFFIYLICVAVLYARTHYRNMVEYAREAGVEEPELLHRDAWRWMADSSWALGSAAVIIVLALAGGPLLQTAVRTVAPDVPLRLQEAIQNQQQPPTGTQNQLNADVRVGRGPVALTDAKVFEVKTAAGEYFRIGSYDQYRGNGWGSRVSFGARRQAIVRPDEFSPQDIGPHGGWLTWPGGTAPLEPIQDPLTYLVEVRNIETPPLHVPTPGPVTEVLSISTSATALPDGMATIVSSTGMTTAYSFVAAVAGGAPLDVDSVDPLRRLSASEVASLRPRTRNGQLPRDDPPELTPRVRQWFEQATEGAQSDYEIAQRLRKAIAQHIVYDTRTPAIPAEKDVVDTVLFETKQGYCDVFATVMAVGAKHLGLHSRYVVGYFDPGMERTADGYSVIRNQHGHAWAEIYFDGYGYVVFDATEGSRANPGGERSLLPRENVSPLARLMPGDVGNVVLGTLAFVGIVLFLYFRKPWTMLQRPTVATRLVGAHQKFIGAIESVSQHPKRFSMTTREYIASASEHLGDQEPVARELARDFDRAFFGPSPPDETTIHRLEDEVKSWAATMKKRPKQA